MAKEETAETRRIRARRTAEGSRCTNAGSRNATVCRLSTRERTGHPKNPMCCIKGSCPVPLLPSIQKHASLYSADGEKCKPGGRPEAGISVTNIRTGDIHTEGEGYIGRKKIEAPEYTYKVRRSEGTDTQRPRNWSSQGEGKRWRQVPRALGTHQDIIFSLPLYLCYGITNFDSPRRSNRWES